MDYEKILEIIKKLKDSVKDITIWIQYLECLFCQNSLKDCADLLRIEPKIKKPNKIGLFCGNIFLLPSYGWDSRI